MNNFGFGLPVAASTYAAKIDFGIYLIHAAMAAIFVLWGIFFTYLLVKYRKRAGVPAVREEHGDGSKLSELKSLAPDIAVMIFEIGLIVFYAVPVWSKIKMSTPSAKDSVLISVVGEQFGWNIHYAGPDGKFGARKTELVHFNNPVGLDKNDPAAADDLLMGNEMHLPLGKPALIELTSKDVIHNFFVPEFRLKQDAVPGMRIPVWVEPTLAGKYEIACAQLCGFAHSLMRGDVVVETQAEFDAWYKSRQAAAPAPAKPADPSEDF